jgi:hypothetical protein
MPSTSPQPPEEAVEALARERFESEEGRWRNATEDEKEDQRAVARHLLRPALPAILNQHSQEVRERLLSDEAVEATVRRRHPFLRYYTLAAKQEAVQDARLDLEAAASIALPDEEPGR